MTERDNCEPPINTVNSAAPLQHHIAVAIPVEYIDWVTVGKICEIYFNRDTCPKDWDAASIPVDIETALKAARLVYEYRQTKEAEGC